MLLKVLSLALSDAKYIGCDIVKHGKTKLFLFVCIVGNEHYNNYHRSEVLAPGSTVYNTNVEKSIPVYLNLAHMCHLLRSLIHASLQRLMN